MDEPTVVKTGVGFYTPRVPLWRLPFTEAVYITLLNLVCRKRQAFVHSVLWVRFSDGYTMYNHLTWDGVETLDASRLDKNYTCIELPVDFDTNKLDAVTWWLYHAGYKLQVFDLIRRMFKRPCHQMLCTDYVRLVVENTYTCKLPHKHLSLTSDQLFHVLRNT